jgi:hypothetical protein
MKKTFYILLFLIIIFAGIYFFLLQNEKQLSTEQIISILNTENVVYFPDNTIIFLNNIKLLDNYLKFKETLFYEKLIKLDLLKKFESDDKIYSAGSKTGLNLRSELTLENLINLIGNNISFGISDYENQYENKFLLVLNIYQQGQFFDKLFTMLENENITRNTRYSYGATTINIIEFKTDNIFLDNLFYMEYEEKFLFSSSKKWLEDILDKKIVKNTISNNQNFNNLIRNISIDFTSLFFFDIHQIIDYAEKYFIEKNQQNYFELIENYKIIQSYLIVNDFLTTENLISYDKSYEFFNINSYLGRPKKIKLLNLLPLKSLFTFSITSFDLNEYMRLVFNNFMRIRNQDIKYDEQFDRFNNVLKGDLQKDIINLMKGELNITVKDMVNTDNLPVVIFKIESSHPKLLYDNLVSMITDAVDKHNLNFVLHQDSFKNQSISFLKFNLPDYAFSQMGFFTLDNYLIFFYGEGIINDIFDIYENKKPSLLTEDKFSELNLESKNLNILVTINTKRGLDILHDVLNGIISFPGASEYTEKYDLINHIDPVFDLLKTLDGFVLYSVKEDNNIIRNIAKFKVD